MAKKATVGVVLSQSIEGRKGLPDLTVGDALEWFHESRSNEDGEPTFTDSDALGFLAVYAVRRMMALSKDEKRHEAGKAPSHVYLPRPVDGAKHSKKLAPAVEEARGAFAAMLWGAKAKPEAAPVKAPKAKPAKKADPAPAPVKASKPAPKAKPAPVAPPAPVKSAKGEARAARIAERAAKKGANPPVARPDLTPATITQPNPTPPAKTVTLANGATFTIENNSGGF